MKFVLIIALITVVLGCASTEPELPPTVSINNGVYSIPESGVFVNGKNGLELKPGTYRFLVKKQWHRDEVKTINVERGQQQFIQIEPGHGYAQGKITVSPANAEFLLNNKQIKGQFEGELDEGKYNIDVSAAGFYSKQFEFDVITGKTFEHIFELDAIPSEASVTITSVPSGAELSLEGISSGISPLIATNLPFGNYKVTAIKQLTENERIVGELEFNFNLDDKKDFSVALDQEQRLFEGKWYTKQQAIELVAQKTARLKTQEENQYRSQRVKSPVDVQFTINELNDKNDMTQDEFAMSLFTLLKVGDRISVNLNGDIYTIWKRQTQLHDIFNQQVAALWQGQTQQFDFKADPAKKLNFTQGSSLITTLAYQLYRSVNTNPIVDLDETMHNFDGYVLPTTDVPLTLITIGGSDIKVNDQEINVTPLIGFSRIAAGTEELYISWKTKPIKLLAVSDSELTGSVELKNAELKVNEKRLVELLSNGNVSKIQRFTKMYGEKWQYDLITKSGPLADTMDLNVNEVGPHKLSGQYQRIWIIDYTDENGLLHKRQLSLNYAVGEQVKEFESDNFFRRKTQ